MASDPLRQPIPPASARSSAFHSARAHKSASRRRSICVAVQRQRLEPLRPLCRVGRPQCRSVSSVLRFASLRRPFSVSDSEITWWTGWIGTAAGSSSCRILVGLLLLLRFTCSSTLRPFCIASASEPVCCIPEAHDRSTVRSSCSTAAAIGETLELLEVAKWVALTKNQTGRMFLFEPPAYASSWSTEMVSFVAELEGR